jgi:hypothetical protein
LDRPAQPVITPFTEHVDEDAERFKETSGEPGPRASDQEQAPESGEWSIDPAAEKLQAIFLTDEPLDLAGTIDKIAKLPGIQACSLTTTGGLKLAGNVRDADQEKVLSSVLPAIFRQTRTRLEELHSAPLEVVTLHCGSSQFSVFVRDNLCLGVVRDARPFKPGVREKIQVVLNELDALSPTQQPN